MLNTRATKSTTGTFPTDGSTWPRRGSLWTLLKERRGWGEDKTLRPHTILMFVKMIYVTKSEITCQFLSADFVHTWTIPRSEWNQLVEPLRPPWNT